MQLTIKHQTGFAMVEVLVTAIVFAIGVAGIGVLLLKTVQGTQDSAQRSQGMWIVQDLVGRMRANPTGARNRAYEDTIDKDDCDEAFAGAVCADHVNASQAVTDAVTCTSDQMASYDIRTTMCGIVNTSEGAKVFDSPAEFLINPRLVSVCNTPGTGKCQLYTVSLAWSTKVAQGVDGEGDQVNESTYSMVVEFN